MAGYHREFPVSAEVRVFSGGIPVVLGQPGVPLI